MTNQDIQAGRDYHEASKLSYINLSNKPPLYKSYTDLPAIPLPVDFSPPEISALDAVAGIDQETGPSLDLAGLAQLLYYSAGLIKKGLSAAAGEVHYRAAASAGALYPVEVYLVSKDVPGLEAGVYHFSPPEFALRQLRKGDYRSELSAAAGGNHSVFNSPATLIFTAVFWRSAWKYRVRSYRYCFWDNGTIVANLLATASAVGLSGKVIAGFVDDRVNDLLGIHSGREASLCLVPVGKPEDTQSVSRPVEIAPLAAEAFGASSEEIEYPEILRLHDASSLTTEEEVVAWRGSSIPQTPSSEASFYPLDVGEVGDVRPGRLGDVIQERGSTRRFARDSISSFQFSTMLDRCTKGVPADFLGSDHSSLLEIYVIVNAVEGLPSGSYFFSPESRGLELLREGAFREEAGHLCYEQALGADASVVVFLMADLTRILEHYGNRGYRAAQLEAGIVGGGTYLCAHSLGLGASGITFYDEDVTDFFSPHASGKSTIFVVPLGLRDRNNRVRPFRSRVAVVLDALARGAGQGDK